MHTPSLGANPKNPSFSHCFLEKSFNSMLISNRLLRLTLSYASIYQKLCFWFRKFPPAHVYFWNSNRYGRVISTSDFPAKWNSRVMNVYAIVIVRFWANVHLISLNRDTDVWKNVRHCCINIKRERISSWIFST